MKKNLLALVAKRSVLADALAPMLENRSGLSESDAAAVDAKMSELTSLDSNIRSLETLIEGEERSSAAAARFGAGITASADTTSATTAGEEIRSAMKAASEGRNSHIELRAQLISDPAKGANTVHTTYAETVLSAVEESAEILGLVDVIRTSTGGAFTYTEERNTLTANWVGEAAIIPDSDLTYLPILTLGNHKLTALSYFSKEMESFSAVQIEARLRAGQADKFAQALVASVFVGDGVNKPTGLYNGAAVGAVVANPEEPSYADLVGMKHSVKSSLRKDGVWVLSEASALHIESLVDGQGRPLFRDTLANAEYPTLLGHRYIVSEHAPLVGFGNLRRAYKFREVSAIETETSREYKFDTAQIAVRSLMFVDGKPFDRDAFKVANVA